MKNNLLFVNQNREIIREFLDAMKEYSFEINTASSSAEVAAFLKKKKYKLVITGINLSGLNGSKLIAYLNQYCPQTVCIVYTRRLELAHLKLLVNDRKVFRIFQKPADFKGEVYHAIMEAFEYYDMMDAKRQEKQILEQKLKSAQANVKDLELAALPKEEEKQAFILFLQTILKTYTQNIKLPLNKKEQHLLYLYEKKLIHMMFENSHDINVLEAIRQEIYTSCNSLERENLEPVIDEIHQILFHSMFQEDFYTIQ